MLRRILHWIYCLPLREAALLAFGVTVLFLLIHCCLGHRRWWKGSLLVLLVGWLAVVLVQTVFIGRTQGRAVSLLPFHSYFVVLQGGEKELLRSAFMNVLLFYPGGVLACCLCSRRKWFVLIGFVLLSVSIELCQYGFGIGTTETDDVMHNTLGAFLGILAAAGVKSTGGERMKRKVGIYEKYIKRLMDFLLSLLALSVLSPVLLILTIVGAVKMKGNPFFTQQRPGRNEKIFKLIKFRTMTCETDENGKLLPDDRRLTKYGKFLRSTSLDELPELINILIGNMSIVGPRPLLVAYLPYYTEEEKHRHDVRPGLTGLAQANGRNNLSWEEKFAYDLEYVANISFSMDISVIIKTALKVLRRADVQVDTQKGEGNLAEIRSEKMKREKETPV